ncbi:MAG: hypothetical protein FH753_17300 [Firmicutes bacterium]|nr:hypothetical protein [Bacillota bacterium]
MKILSDKKQILYLIIIIILVSILIIKDYRYKTTVGNYDLKALIMLERELYFINESIENNKFSEETLKKEKENMERIAIFISSSPNIGYMSDYIINIMDYKDKDEFVYKRFNYCKNLHKELKELHKKFVDGKKNGINTYRYFNSEKNKNNFINLLKGKLE